MKFYGCFIFVTLLVDVPGYQQFTSRSKADFPDKLLSAMRFEFGGHVEEKP